MVLMMTVKPNGNPREEDGQGKGEEKYHVQAGQCGFCSQSALDLNASQLSHSLGKIFNLLGESSSSKVIVKPEKGGQST